MWVISDCLNHLVPDKLGLNGAISLMRSTYSTARKFSSGGWCGTALTVYLDGSDGVPVKPITQPFMFTNGMASKACGF